jgi:CRP-like cAMP-binding protein
LPRHSNPKRLLAKSDSVVRCARRTQTGPQQSKEAVPPSKRDGDGHDIVNAILLNLPAEEWARVLPNLEFVRLRLGQVIQEAGETLKSGYFCNSGLFSVLTVMPDGKSVEVGLVGKEGFSAVPLVAGFRTSYARTVVQTEGTAFRIDATLLRGALRECPVLERQLQRHSQFLAAQAAQIAACNRLHEVEEQLARWLLMTQDRIQGNSLPLTQEFIAQMLGTRRSSVTVSAGTAESRIDHLHPRKCNDSKP